MVVIAILMLVTDSDGDSSKIVGKYFIKRALLVVLHMLHNLLK